MTGETVYIVIDRTWGDNEIVGAYAKKADADKEAATYSRAAVEELEIK